MNREDNVSLIIHSLIRIIHCTQARFGGN